MSTKKRKPAKQGSPPIVQKGSTENAGINKNTATRQIKQAIGDYIRITGLRKTTKVAGRAFSHPNIKLRKKAGGVVVTSRKSLSARVIQYYEVPIPQAQITPPKEDSVDVAIIPRSKVTEEMEQETTVETLEET